MIFISSECHLWEKNIHCVLEISFLPTQYCLKWTCLNMTFYVRRMKKQCNLGAVQRSRSTVSFIFFIYFLLFWTNPIFKYYFFLSHADISERGVLKDYRLFVSFPTLLFNFICSWIWWNFKDRNCLCLHVIVISIINEIPLLY